MCSPFNLCSTIACNSSIKAVEQEPLFFPCLMFLFLFSFRFEAVRILLWACYDFLFSGPNSSFSRLLLGTSSSDKNFLHLNFKNHLPDTFILLGHNTSSSLLRLCIFVAAPPPSLAFLCSIEAAHTTTVVFCHRSKFFFVFFFFSDFQLLLLLLYLCNTYRLVNLHNPYRLSYSYSLYKLLNLHISLMM